jgi:phage regulatory protein, rha family
MTSQPLVRHSGNRLITTSLAISNNFNKKHKDVLRAVENLECSQEFRKRNFAPTSYKTSQGKVLPAYEITRDGFVFLCMGFTGAQAAQWKEKYIEAFNRLEAEIYRREAQPAIDAAALERLRQAYLDDNPQMADLLRYRDAGLKQTEAAILLGVSPQTVRERLKKAAALGLCDYRPSEVLAERGRLGMAALREKRAFAALQMTLPIGG